MGVNSLENMLAAKDKGCCPFCNKQINESSEFRDTLSKREFQISGLCQRCQDRMFKE